LRKSQKSIKKVSKLKLGKTELKTEFGIEKCENWN